jgi:hypothetical protein
MAGVIGMSRRRFLFADTLGCALWLASYLLAGFVFHHTVEALTVQIGLFGKRAGLVAICLLAAFVALKYIQRWRILRELRVNRITPLAVQELLDKSKDSITVVDLRHPSEVERDAFKIPGAILMRPEELRALAREIPPEQEIILYCT